MEVIQTNLYDINKKLEPWFGQNLSLIINIDVSIFTLYVNISGNLFNIIDTTVILTDAVITSYDIFKGDSTIDFEIELTNLESLVFPIDLTKIHNITFDGITYFLWLEV